MMEAHHMMNFHHMMELHYVMGNSSNQFQLCTALCMEGYTFIQLPWWAWWSHCLWQASPRWPWWWPVWPRPSSCCSRWGSFLLLGPAATVPRQLVPTSWMGSTTTRGSFCKKKQSLLDNTVITNSNTKLHDFVLLMYQFCNSHQT